MRLSGLVPVLFLTQGLLAQAAQVQIVADRARLTAGESLTLKAVLADDKGKVLPGQDVSWSITPQTATIARVSEQGVLTGVLPGVAVVRVQSGNASLEMAFQVLPKRITVTPGDPELLVGDTRTFTATAFDVNDRPIPGVSFAWSVLTTYGFGDAGALGTLVIDQRGQARARQEGKSYIRAQLNYTVPGYGLPVGMTPFSSGQTLATVKVPGDYTTKVLYSTAQPPPASTLGDRTSPLWATPDGSLFLRTALGATTTGLVRYKDGELRTLVTAGGSATATGSRVLDVPGVSVNLNGDYLVLEQTNDGNRLRRYLADGTANTILVANVPAAGVERLSNFNISRNSLNRNGQFVFTAAYYDPVERQAYSGLFLGAGVSVEKLLLTTKQGFSDFPQGFRVDMFGIADDGAVYARLTGLEFQGAQSLYRIDEGGTRRVIGSGDTLAGGRITELIRSSDSQDTFVARNGDLLFGVNFANGMRVVRYDAATQTFDSMERTPSWMSVLDYHPDHGALVYAAPGYRNSLWLWKGGKAQMLANYDAELIGGRRLVSLDSAPCGGAFGPNGEVNIYCRTAEFGFVGGQLLPERRLFFKTGDAVDGGRSVFHGFMKGPGPVQLFSGLNSVAEWDGTTIKDYLAPGTAFDGNTFYTGSSGPAWSSQLADGSIIQFGSWFRGSQYGVIRYRPDRTAQMLILFNVSVDGVGLFTGFAQANDAEDVLVHCATDAGDTRVFLFRDGKGKTLLISGVNPRYQTQIDGLTVTSYREPMLNAKGEVLALVTYRERGANAVAVWWDGANWRTILQAGQDRLGGRLVTSIGNVRRVGDAFWLSVGTDRGPNGVARCLNGRCELVASADEIGPTGLDLSSITNYEANAQGDVVVFAHGTGLYVKRQGKWYSLLNLAQPLEGHNLVQVLDMQLRDDGTVYLLLVNSRSETLLVEAKPKA